MTEVRLSAVVMTHPKRRHDAEEMQDRHPDLGLRIVEDPAPDEQPSALRTARTAWAALAPDATHHLVIEDDTVLCADFHQHLLAAIAARPGHAISFYTEWGSETSYAVRLAALLGDSWAEVVDDYVPTQALVLPARVAGGFPGFDAFVHRLYDHTMHAYLASAEVPAAMTVPNLADDARLSSVLGHGFLGERASVCFPADAAGAVDWTASAPRPTTVPAFSYAIGHPYTVVRSDSPGRRWRRGRHPAMPGYATALARGRAAIGCHPAAVRHIGSKLLLGLWSTAYGLGWVAADLLGHDQDELERAMARPFARHALATLPDGALRFLIDDQLRAELGDDLRRLVERAVREGATTTTEEMS